MSEEAFRLHRSLSLTQMVLYGVGTTVGAGIYALIGEIAGVAGFHAMWSFLLASALAGFTAISFAQLSRRYPRAAGTALYVQKGFDSANLARLVGLLVILAGVVSSAALLNGFYGYLAAYLDPGRTVVISLAAVALCAVAAWGVSQSVWVAGIVSIIEVGGLVWIIALGLMEGGDAEVVRVVVTPPPADIWPAVLAGGVLAFYAYIGFEDMVEVAEEVRDVERNLPRAIFLTLGITTVVYVALVATALLALEPTVLANATAPLAEVFRALTGQDPVVISLIGMLAIINGALIQVIMASRVVYGLANRGQLPRVFARVRPGNQIPVIATVVVSAIVWTLALVGELVTLAEVTSAVMLTIFALANFALYRLLRREHGNVWLMVSSVLGGIVCAALTGWAIAGWL